MPARRLDGAAAAAAIRADLAASVTAFTASAGRAPSLSIVLVGDDPASHVYVRNKERAGQETGLAVAVRRLPVTASLAELLTLVRSLNEDDGVDGILVQSPLPAAMGKGAAQQVFDTIDPAKDVDGFHAVNAGLLLQGRPVLPPCTPSGVMALLDREGISVAGRHAVVVGRSEIVGKPAALLLLQRDATVTICHSRTGDLGAMTRQADVLIAAVGRPGFITASMVRPGAVVIDVGTTPVADRTKIVELFGEGSARLASFEKKGSTVVGDAHPSVADVASALSPVPGGIGPLTIAMLLKNTLAAAKNRSGRFLRGT
jgi:methylenetetrahydrofolate dehydrogenase (NADP+)/methenyltetrahydrofolate cyclohydrolase